MKRVLILFASIFVFVVSAVAQRYEDGWKGIKPLSSTRTTVNSAFGTPEVDSDGFYFYRTDDTFIRVNYSSAKCGDLDRRWLRSFFEVPEWTVVDYYVLPKDSLKLSESGIDLKKFHRDTSGDFRTVVNYWPYVGDGKRSTDKGFSFSTNQLDTEYLRRLTYKPLEQEFERKKCSGKS